MFSEKKLELKYFYKMNDKLEIILKSAEDKMQSSLLHLENELLNIRAGKANPNMLKSVMVDYYGNPTAIGQLANINTPDSKSLIVHICKFGVLYHSLGKFSVTGIVPFKSK